MTDEEFERQSQLRTLLTETKKRAKRKGQRFDLDFKWVVRAHDRQRGKCVLTGLPFITQREAKHYRNPFAPSIDRIISSQGYTRRNCRLVCCAVNLALGEWGESVFEQVVQGYFRQKFP